MRGFRLGLSLSVAFILGCVAAPLVVPPLSAQQAAAGVPRWEYKCIADGSSFARRRGTYEAQSNALGRQGWEMSGGDAYVLCFKRPLL